MIGWRTSSAAIVMLAAAALPGAGHRASAHLGPARIGAATEAGGSIIVKSGLFDWLFGGGPRDEPRGTPERAPPRDGQSDEEQPAERRNPAEGATYKTYCVRLCDGFYFPISPSVRRESFSEDAKKCEQSCPSRSRLFTMRVPREDTSKMVDLEGHPYSDLPTAFQHLTRYDASCTCRGNPWDEEALARHRAYAQEAEHGGANQVAQHSAAPVSKPQTRRRAARQNVWGYRAERRTRRDYDNDD
jgi:hypothetical protein